MSLSAGFLSYGFAAVGFVVLAALLCVSWEGRAQGIRLIVACLVTAAWAALVAWHAQRGGIPTAVLVLAEILRYGAWFTVVTGLMRTAGIGATLARVLHAFWVACAVALLAGPAAIRSGLRWPDLGSLLTWAGLGLSLLGLIALEQIYRNAREAGRYAMHGILTQVEGDELKMVATDGRRLAVATAALEQNGTTASKAIVPTKGMQTFCRVIDDPTERVQIHFGENQFGLKTAKAEVFARLIDGEFPRYTAVIPTSTQNVVEADARLFNQKLKLVANVTSTDTRAVRLSIQKEKLAIFGRSAAMGEASAHLDVRFEGKPCDIAFNPDYLMDGLKNCEQDEVRLEFNEKNSPGKFTLGENYIYIVMPITIDG